MDNGRTTYAVSAFMRKRLARENSFAIWDLARWHSSCKNRRAMKSLLTSLGLSFVAVACAAPSQTSGVGESTVTSARTQEAKPELVETPAPVEVAKAETKEEAAPAASTPLPTCVKDKDGTCFPSLEYVKRLCSGSYPDVALSLFAKDSPWGRGYISHDTFSWNTFGARTSRAKVSEGEEIVLLRKHDAQGGIIVTGSAVTYDALRWDGSCVSVDTSEFSTKKPAGSKRMPLAWDKLEDATKQSLRGSPKVAAMLTRLEKDCAGSDKAKCDRADAALSGAIVEQVRSGMPLPVPSRHP